MKYKYVDAVWPKRRPFSR